MDGKTTVWFRNFKHYYKMHPTLVAGIYGGCVGVLVDLDHPVAFFFHIKDGRFFHYPLFFIVFAVFCGLCAYIGGLLLLVVLRRRNKKILS